MFRRVVFTSVLGGIENKMSSLLYSFRLSLCRISVYGFVLSEKKTAESEYNAEKCTSAVFPAKSRISSRMWCSFLSLKLMWPLLTTSVYFSNVLCDSIKHLGKGLDFSARKTG